MRAEAKSDFYRQFICIFVLSVCVCMWVGGKCVSCVSMDAHGSLDKTGDHSQFSGHKTTAQLCVRLKSDSLFFPFSHPA